MNYKGKIDLYVYTGADGYFELYEDENVNYNYEKQKKLVIGEREGEFDEMLESRKFKVIFVSGNKPVGFDSDKSEGILVEYNGKRIEVNVN